MDLTPNTFSAEQEADLEAAVRRWQARQCAENMQRDDDECLAIKGIVAGVCLSVPIWLVLGAVVFAVLN